MITTWYEAEQTYDQYVDETHGPINILGIEYDAARTLKAIDPIHYREAILNWLDFEGIDTDELAGELSV